MYGVRALFQYIGLRHMVRRPFRTALTALGVALGVALYIAITIINRSTLNSFKDNIESVAGKAGLTISGGQAGFPEDVLDRIKKVPGVKHAVPMIEARAYFAGERNTETLMIFGVDLLQEQAVRTYKTTDQQIIDDPLVFLNQPDSLIVTQSFAKEFGLKIDSTLNLATARGVQKFTVRGLLTPEGPAKAFGGSIAIMDIDGARMTFGKEGKLDRVDVVANSSETLDVVAERLRVELGPSYTVERPETQSENMQRMVQSYQGMLSFFSLFALLVGIFLVSNSLNMAVAERRREIGSLRSLGATRSGIMILFMAESLVIGLIGSALGAVLGRLMAGGLVGAVSKATEAQFFIKVQVARIIFGAPDVILALAMGTIAACVASFVPAFRATRVQPLEAMKRENAMKSEIGEKNLFWRFAPFLALTLLVLSAIVSIQHWGGLFPGASLLNQVAAIFGATLLAPFLATGMIRMIRWATLRMDGTVMRLAQENLLRNPRRTGGNIMSLLVGLMLVVSIAIVGQSFKQTMLEWFDRVFKMDLVVSSNGRIISFQMQSVNQDLGLELMKVPGVKPHFSGKTPGMRFVHQKFQGERIGMKTFDEPDADLHYATLDVLDRPREEAGYELFHSPDPVVMVSQNFVKNFNKKTGDNIELNTPSGTKSFRIVGVVTDFASPVGIVYMKRSMYRDFWKDPLMTMFSIRVLPGFDPDQVRREINRRFSVSKNLVAASSRELRQDLVNVVDQSFYFVYAIEFAALLVGLLGLLNTMTISVLERTREIGMLRAVGMSRRQLFGMIFQESIVQGLVGAVAAVILGTYMVYFWVKYNLTEVLGWMVDFHFPIQSILITVASGVLVACIAGWYPARRASKIIIREALDYE